MKSTLLVGLAAIALGSMTACSNILEEEGTISAKTGTLTIALDQDNSVNVITKTDDENNSTYEVPSNLYNVENFTVSVTNASSESVSSLSGTYSGVKNSSVLAKTGNYTLTAYNKAESEVKDFAWDEPYFYGTKEGELEAGGSLQLSATCELKNTIINVDLGALLTNTEDDLEVVSLTAKNSSSSSSFSIYANNAVSESKTLGTNMIYARAETGAYLELVVKSNSLNKEKTIKTEIKGSSESTNKAKTKYNVTYSVSTTQGVLSISISVNGQVDVVEIKESVNPYDTTEQQES